MSESTRSRVTVTLGPSGRVVKRAGGDEGFQNGMSVSGNKCSVRDRLGGNSDDRYHPYDKRQRREIKNNTIDVCLGQDDLRFKLMQKDIGQESRNSGSLRNVDLREKLSSRTSRPSVDSLTMRPPESAASTRHPAVDPMNSGMTRQPLLRSRDASILGRVPPLRNPSEQSMMDRARPGSWTLENLRRRSPENLIQMSSENLRRRSPESLRRRSPADLRERSPERLVRPSAPRGFSPARNRDHLQRRPLIRNYDDVRTSSIRVGPVQSSSFLTQSSLPAAPVTSVAPLPQRYTQASGIVQRIPSTADEHVTVDSLLQSLGLEKYAIYFKAEEVDMNALRQLGDNDLKDLGIPMGPRKKIIQAVAARSRRHL